MNKYHFNFITWQRLHNELILGFYEVTNINTIPEELVFLEPDDYKGNLRIYPDKIYKIKTNRGTWYLFNSIPYKVQSIDPLEEVEDLVSLIEMCN